MNDTLKNYITAVCCLNVFFLAAQLQKLEEKRQTEIYVTSKKKARVRLAQHLQSLKTLGFSRYYQRAVKIPLGTLTFFPPISAKSSLVDSY